MILKALESQQGFIVGENKLNNMKNWKVTKENYYCKKTKFIQLLAKGTQLGMSYISGT